MVRCFGIKANKERCTRTVKSGKLCWQHKKQIIWESPKSSTDVPLPRQRSPAKMKKASPHVPHSNWVDDIVKNITSTRVIDQSDGGLYIKTGEGKFDVYEENAIESILGSPIINALAPFKEDTKISLYNIPNSSRILKTYQTLVASRSVIVSMHEENGILVWSRDMNQDMDKMEFPIFHYFPNGTLLISSFDEFRNSSLTLHDLATGDPIQRLKVGDRGQGYPFWVYVGDNENIFIQHVIDDENGLRDIYELFTRRPLYTKRAVSKRATKKR